MWIISSHEVEQAKERLSGRRAEIEARYAAEKGALDAELEAVETLERVAAEFAARNTRDEPVAAAAPAAGAEPPGADDPAADDPGRGEADALGGGAPASPESDPPGGEEIVSGLDIVKPGSRWRFNRGARLAGGDETAGGASPTSW